ncbi:MAG: GH1 family beta-glucosidase [Phycisphaerae bacterium]
MTHSRSGFLWGAATAAFQVEGAAREDGRGPSIWDVFCHTPGKTSGDSGDVTCDHYHRWREDIDLMRALNLNAYRFSVSWPRVLPQGRGPLNAAGLDFYDRLVDALCAANIAPLVTCYHWDLPAALQMELGGWLHPDLPKIFADYAAVLFDRLADRVPLWLTVNEPWVIVDAGYVHGVHPPGVRDQALGYRAGHNLLRAHAYAVARYRAGRHNTGAISFALNSSYSFSATASPDDQAAAERAMQNFAGWFGDPCYFGDYPALLRERLGALLPEFTDADAALLTRSMDFLALNYYTSDVVRHAPGAGPMEVLPVPQPDVPRTEMDWPILPKGLELLALWLHDRYPGLPLYITENGAAMHDEPDSDGFVRDVSRIDYLGAHLDALDAAAARGVDVRGYFAWSLLDNLEWSAGFARRFGLVRCDHATQRRTIKASGHWYARRIASAASGVDGLATEGTFGAKEQSSHAT